MKLSLTFLLLVSILVFSNFSFSQELIFYEDFADGQLPPGMRLEFGTATVESGYIDWQLNSRYQFGTPYWSNYTVRMEVEFLSDVGRLYAHWDKGVNGLDDSYSYRIWSTLSASTHLDDFDGIPNQHHYNILQSVTSLPVVVGEPYVFTFGSNDSGVFGSLGELFNLHVQNDNYRSGYVAIECSAPARINWIEVVGTLSSDLIGYWRFEEGVTGETATAENSIWDYSGNGNYGTPNGSPVYSSDVPTSFIPHTGQTNNGSLEFTSGGGEVVFNSIFPFHEPGDVTVEFFLKVHEGSLYGCPLWTRIGNDDRNRFNFQYNSDRSLMLDYREPSGNRHPIIDNAPLVAGQWHHLAYVRSGNSYSLFKDGILIGSGDDPAPALPNFEGWSISGRSVARLNGCIDELRLTARALTPDEFLIAPRGGMENVGVFDGADDPDGFAMFQNHPNPFNPSTTIIFSLPQSCRVSLCIYDVSGRLVRDLIAGQDMEAGRFERAWNGQDQRGQAVAAGVYFFKLRAGGFEKVKRMALVR